VVAAGAVLLVLAGCSSESSDWKDAQTKATPEALQEFLKRHPNGQFRQAATERLEESLYRPLEGDVARAHAKLFGQKSDREGGSRLLGEILAKAPNHPLALSYSAHFLAVDKKYDQAIVFLNQALKRGDTSAPSCRSKDQLDRWKYFLERKCIGHILHGWADVNPVMSCPPGEYGSEQWKTSIEAIDYNITSIAITKRFDSDNPADKGICP